MNAQLRHLPVIGRLLIGMIFLISGADKIVAPTMTQGYITSTGLPAELAYLIAVVTELGGGLLLVLGSGPVFVSCCQGKEQAYPVTNGLHATTTCGSAVISWQDS